uniref:Pepsin-I3 domain-containing protein n=1 Tax=Ascaris lumbricoides TaxID=6252 RepID=A0A0M3HZA3_ASCLU
MTASFQGIDLYVDEKKLSPLTSAQQIEFAEYQKQMADYERDVQKYEELMSQGDAGLPPPQPPPRPSFCNVPMVYLDGCVALVSTLLT